MRHVLFIAYHYPPENSSSGVLRTLKHTRYLGRFGWRVTVLTLDRRAYDTVDPQLEAQVPADVRVVRTPFIEVKRHLAVRGRYPAILAIPDRWIGWWPWAVAAGRRIVRSDPVDVIYSTSPHATAHLIALSLARRARIPWVVDFRDPWYEDPPEPGMTRIGQFAARRLERRVVARADRIVASTARLRNMLAARYPWRPEAFIAIPNGYDEGDFAHIAASADPPGDEMLIVHAGSINENFRDPRPVFEAVRRAVAEGRMERSRIRLRFLGAGPFGESAAMREAVRQAGLTSNVEFRPRLSYQDSLLEQSRASVLLLLQASPDTIDLVPAKLFEYLRTGRPVLALVPEGATSEVLRETGGGWVVEPGDSHVLSTALVTAYRAWASGRLRSLAADPQRLETFSRERLAAVLASQFNALVGGRG
jgi:glycosyltransferase involved in cell wall biosynthesis